MRFIEQYLKKKFLYTEKSNLLKSFYYFVHRFYSRKGAINKSYTRHGLDLLVNWFFRNTQKGVYIDVGCWHPRWGNNTYLLHKRGWQGINLDLDLNTIEMFKSFRPDDFNKRIAVSDNNGFEELYFYHNHSPINTISKDIYEKRNTKTEVQKIPCQTLSSIIAETKFKDQKINYLDIDVEGHELSVLKGFDLQKYSPDVVTLEFLEKDIFLDNNINNIVNSKIYKYMILNRYKFVNWINSDLVFLREDYYYSK